MADKDVWIRLYPYRVERECAVVGCVGRMQSTGITLTSNPPQYPHRCTMCEIEDTYVDERFPHIAYQETDDG